MRALAALRRLAGALCSPDLAHVCYSRAPYRAGSRIMLRGRSQEITFGDPGGRDRGIICAYNRAKGAKGAKGAGLSAINGSAE